MSHPFRYFYCFLFLNMLLPVVFFAQEQMHIPADEKIIETDTFSLSVQLEDVVVTAQYAPTHSKNALQNIRTIEREAIERLGANNLEQLLQQDLNVSIQQDPILGSSMSLLGVGGENIKIMIDGVPMVGRLNGNIDLSQINLNNIERIEIVEGPMSVNYGTDALGGVINLITKKTQVHNYELSLHQQLETRAESSTAFEAGIRWQDKWLMRVNAGRDWFEGISSDSIRSVLWNPKEQWYTDVLLRYDFTERQRIHYQFSFFDESVTNLGDIRRPQFKPYAFDDYFLTRRTNHALHHEGQIADNYYIQSTLGYNDFNRRVHSYRHNFEEQEAHQIGGDTTLFDTYMLRSVLASRFRDRALNFQLGLDLRREHAAGARITNANETDDEYLEDYAIFGSLRYNMNDRLSIETGLRATYHSRYNAPLIPSFHLKYQFNDPISLRLSYGKGFRSPSLKELFLSFIDINHFLIGNPDLEAETSDNIQLNIQYQSKEDRFTARFHTFYNRIEDQIQLFPFIEKNGELVPTTPDQSIQYAYFNLENAETHGFNLRSSYRWRNWELEGGASIIGFYNPMSEDFKTVNQFSYIQEFSGRLGYTLPLTNTHFNAFLRHNDRFISYYPELRNGETTARQRIQDGFTWVDFSLAQNILNDRIQLTAGIRNLLNINQINIAGANGGVHTSGNSIPIGAGRSFFIRASVRLFDNRAAKFKNAAFEQQQKQAFQLHQLSQQTYATWIEEPSEEEKIVQYAQRKNGSWGIPKTITIGNEYLLTNNINAPQLTQFPNSKTMLASWLKRTSRRNVYDHDIWISLTDKTGSKWKTPFRLAQTDVPSFYGLLTCSPLPNERLLAVWMDGRDTKEETETKGRFMPKMDGELQLRSLELDEKGNRYEAQFITSDISPLCPFAQVATDGNNLIFYRNKAQNITYAEYQNGEWQAPQVLTKDDWTISSTIQAPAADALNENIAVAWYTENKNSPKWQLAISADEGKSFDIVLSKKHAQLKGNMAVRWWSEEVLCVLWLEEQKGRIQLILSYLDQFGNVLHQEAVASASMLPDVALHQPMLTIVGNQLLIAWKPYGTGEVNWWEKSPAQVLGE